MALTLAQSQTVTSAGVGALVSTGLVLAGADVTISVTALDDELTVSLIGDDGVLDMQLITTVGKHTLRGIVGSKVQIGWDPTAPATFNATAVTQQCYCELGDLSSAIRDAAIEEHTTRERLEHLFQCSAVANGYIASAYQLPLTAWGLDLRKATAALWAASLVRARGAHFEGPDGVVIKAEADAFAWLRNVANGRINPPDIVDSTPDEEEYGLVVASRPQRGWGCP